MKFRALLSLLCLVGILLTLYLTNLFLKSNFYENGEAYMKGFGHLLEENRVKGIFFITIRTEKESCCDKLQKGCALSCGRGMARS